MPNRGPTLRTRARVAYQVATAWALRHHRLARGLFAARDVRRRGSALALRGEAVTCSCCGGRFRRMGGWQVAPWQGTCPRCGAFRRQRAIALLLPELEVPGSRVLHFAPEQCFDRVFPRLPQFERVTTDLYAPADLQLDITNMDLEGGSFDLVICSHVLEHVPDDRAALAELRRIVSPGGLALILAPYLPFQPTQEDPTLTSPLERTVKFGQHDHFRRYGTDFPDRIRDAGFEVQDRNVGELFDPETIARYTLRATERMLFCRVPGGPTFNAAQPNKRRVSAY